MDEYGQRKNMSMKHAYMHKHTAAKDKAKARRSINLNSVSSRTNENIQVNDEVHARAKTERVRYPKKQHTLIKKKLQAHTFKSTPFSKMAD